MENQLTTKSTDIQTWKQNWPQLLGATKVTTSMTYADLRKLDTPSISTLNYGEKNTLKGESVFQSLILKLVQYFEADWSEEKVMECGKICFEEWHMLTFADLLQFSKLVKCGGLKRDGQALIYGKLTPATIIDWFCAYSEMKLAEKQAYHENYKPEWKSPENPVPDEKISELFQTFTSTLQSEIDAKAELEAQEREKKLKAYNELLQNQARHAALKKTKTENQVPDQCENNIPDGK